MTPWVLSGFSFAAALVVLVVTVVAGSPLVILVGIVGVVLLGAGTVIGRPAMVIAGAGSLMIAYAGAFTGQTQPSSVSVLIVAPVLWVSVEAALRSFEARPNLGADPEVSIDWLTTVLMVVAATAAFATVTITLVRSVPGGGLTFRILAVGVLLVAATAVGVIDLRRRGRVRPTPRARGAGSASPVPPIEIERLP